MNINRLVLTGNLTRDPELKSLPSGVSLCQFSIAVNSREKRNGEWQDRVDYFDCVVFGRHAENLHRFKHKGEPVAIDGRLRQDRWKNKDGENRTKVVVSVDTVQFLPTRDRNSSDSQGGGQGYGGGQPVPGSSYADAPAPTGGAYGQPAAKPAEDDDIPF